ncbi:MAG: HlyD family efflux transporter periplasmic adaptor subunit, partial [Gemmatimonadales bacterium]|nr:HlyD family efflux transporter periplasmic adaptor subunit [Gemmatimonadales bacterium]
NRSGRGRDGGSTQVQASMSGSTSVQGAGSSRSTSGSTSGGASGGSAMSSAGGAGGATGGTGASAGFSAPSSGSAFRSATSRVATSRAAATRSSTSSSSSRGAATGSSASGSDGLGSTGNQLGQGGGGGGGGGGGFGGGGEFTLILQDLVKPGSRVKKGEQVAEFDRQFMLQRIDDYKSSVAQQVANVQKLKAELEMYREAHRQTIATAKAALDKAKLDVRTTPVLSAIDAERVKLALEEAEAQYKQVLSEVRHVEASEKAQIRNAELDLKAAELELRRAEQNADRMVSRASIDGMTVMQNIMRGSEFAQIQQGDQLYPGQFFMQVVDTSSMVINATLNQVDAERLRVGYKATVRFDAYPDLVLPAHVVALAAVTKTGGFRASYVKEIPVRLKLDKIDPRVIPDLSVSIDVEIASEEAAASVPLAAIQRESANGQAFVYVRSGEAWTRRPVELGLTNFLVAAVKQGLKPGDVVALEPPPATEKS